MIISRRMLLLLLALAVTIAAGCAGLVALQEKMIYLPSDYSDDYLNLARSAGVEEIPFETSQGKQVAFYYPNENNSQALPQTLWICHNGNGSVALQWQRVLEGYPDKRAGFLWVDYPSYGLSEGKPDPSTVLESTGAALDALITAKDWPVEVTKSRISLLGHSLGSAAVLQFAASPPEGVRINRVVCIAPFTSMEDMVAERGFGLLKGTLRHRYDNVTSLQTVLANKENAPDVHILHGDADFVIPVKMGRALHALDDQRVEITVIPDGDHNQILLDAQADIFAAMLGQIDPNERTELSPGTADASP